MLDTVLTYILDMTVSGSIVILVVLLARLALRRMPKIFSYCLWTVVLLRLLCPVGITLPIQTQTQLPSVSEHYSLGELEIPLQEAGSAAMTGLHYATNHNPSTDLVQIPQKGASVTKPNEIVPTVSCSPWETWVLLGQYVWAVGMLAVIGVSLVQYLRLRKRIREAVCLENNVYLVDSISTPFVLGLLRPKIYLPSAVTEDARKYVLQHEAHHIRRLDPLWKLLGFLALCLHWFNPLVWLAFSLATQDMEMSCDEAVARKLSTSARADYAQSLLRFSTNGFLRVNPAFGMGNTSKRIRNLQQWKQPKRWLALLTAFGCMLLMVGCMASGTYSPSVTDTPGISDAPATTKPTGDTEILPAPGAALLFDIHDDSYDNIAEKQFQLPEFPNTQFLQNGSYIYMEIDGQWEEIFYGYQLYIADLNGDGKREFLATQTVGSGIIDYRIYVYDVADDMLYCMHRRAESDFGIALVDGQLVVQQYDYMGIHHNQQPIAEGSLLIENRKLYFVNENWRIPGFLANTQFGPELLESIYTNVQDYVSRGMWFSVYYNDATNFYLERNMDVIGPAIIEEEERRIWIDSELMQEHADTLQYLELINRLMDPYRYFGMPGRYVYLDPEHPEQMFICTELRDTDYRDIRSYYEAVTSGQVQAHRDTYIVRLDENAIYRWGESENLYTPYHAS